MKRTMQFNVKQSHKYVMTHLVNNVKYFEGFEKKKDAVIASEAKKNAGSKDLFVYKI